MSTSKTFFTLIVSGFGLFAFFNSVFATCTTKEVQEADARWAKALNSHEVVQVVNLYTPQAVLLATKVKQTVNLSTSRAILSTTVKNNPITTQQGRVSYFSHLFKTYPHLKVEYTGEKHIQIYGDGAVSTGSYTFSWKEDNKYFELSAPYTFVYRATPNGCELIAHHSSKFSQ